jgi:hypothetical protein
MHDGPKGGRWSGWWRQGLREGHEALDLVISGGIVRGSGQDQDGEFLLEGSLHADGTASLTKRYTQLFVPRPARLTCKGHWNGRVLRGSWSGEGEPNHSGPFLLWPVAS